MRQLKKLRELWSGMFSKPVYGSCGGGDPAVWEENARKQSAERSQKPDESRPPPVTGGERSSN